MGVNISVPMRDEETKERLSGQWSRALTDEEVDTRLVLLTEGLDDPLDLDYAVASRVTLAALEFTAGKRISLHAGAVSDDAGRALAVVCGSGGGKTTAIEALAANYGYVSDETVSLDLDGVSIHPHPKPLSICIPDEPVDGAAVEPLNTTKKRQKRSVSPDELNLGATPDTARLRRLVLLRRDGTNTGLAPITTPEAIVEIVPQTSSLVMLENPMLTLANTIDACGGAFALHYSEIADHLDTLDELLASDLPAAPEPVHHPYVAGRSPVGAEWARREWSDAVQYDDQVVVLAGTNAHLLTGLGTTMWLTLAETTELDALVETATEIHGPHPEAKALVEAALEELAAQGLVARPGEWEDAVASTA